MSLTTWLESRWLAQHVTSRKEIADLLEVVDRDLDDAAVDRLSPDWRLGIAYNAALQLATLALAAEGYRPARERAHERAIESLRLTVGLEQGLVDTLDRFRRKRNQLSYEQAGTSSPSEAAEALEIARGLDARVRQWMKDRHPELL